MRASTAPADDAETSSSSAPVPDDATVQRQFQMMLQCYSSRFCSCLDGGHFGLLASSFEQRLTLVPDPAPTQRLVQMLLQPSTSSAEVPEPDSSVAHMEGIFIFLHFFFSVGQMFYFWTLRGSSRRTESVESEFARFRARLLCFWS